MFQLCCNYRHNLLQLEASKKKKKNFIPIAIMMQPITVAPSMLSRSLVIQKDQAEDEEGSHGGQDTGIVRVRCCQEPLKLIVPEGSHRHLHKPDTMSEVD